MSMHNGFCIAATIALVAATVGACQKTPDMPAQLGDEDGGVTPPPGGGHGGDSGQSDAASDGDAAACTHLANNAPIVAETNVGEALPMPLGGTIPTGTYFLTGLNVYTGVGGNAGPTGRQLTETTTLDGTNRSDVSLVGLADGGTGTPTYANGTYTTAGTAFSFASTCPPQGQQTFTYTVIGTSTLHLFAAPTELIFTLQP